MFKEDWELIFDYLNENYSLHEDPYAYYRTGDDNKYIEGIKSKGIKVYPNEDGYRSIHVLIEVPGFKKTKKPLIIEVQIRTVFEEAWSEIGHSVRYPNNVNNEHLNNYFKIYNRFVGTLDEMGTYIRSSHINDKKLEKKKDSLINRAYKYLDKESKNEETSIIKSFYDLISTNKYDNQLTTPNLKDRKAYFDKAVELLRENPTTYRSVIEGPIFLHPLWVVKIRNEKYKKSMPNYDTVVKKYLRKHSNPNSVKFIIRLSNRYKEKLDSLIPDEKKKAFKDEMIQIVTNYFSFSKECPQILCQRTGFISVSEIYDNAALESDKSKEDQPLKKGWLHKDERFVQAKKNDFDRIFQWNFNDNQEAVNQMIKFYKNLWSNVHS